MSSYYSNLERKNPRLFLDGVQCLNYIYLYKQVIPLTTYPPLHIYSLLAFFAHYLSNQELFAPYINMKFPNVPSDLQSVQHLYR